MSSISASRSTLRGRIVAWDYEAWNPTRGSRPGTVRPGNVVTGFLAGFEPAPFAPRAAGARPPRSTTAATPRRPTSPAASADGCGGTGVVSSERVLSHAVESPFWTGPLRSPSRLQNTFAHECFIDEVAASVEGRSRGVSAAAPARPAAARGRGRRGQGGELGGAPVTEAGPRRPESPGAAASRACSTRATTATARWSPRSRSIRTPGRSPSRDASCALDCGPISNPDGAAQPDRRRHRPGHQPHAARRGDVGRRAGHVGRLAHLSAVVSRRSRPDHRERASSTGPMSRRTAPARRR